MIEVDIHYRKPTVDVALSMLKNFISNAKKSHEKILKVIVGYGSTGGTHKIKTASLDYLEETLKKRQIKGYICGNDLDIFSKAYQSFPFRELIPEEEKRILNKGAIFIVL